MPTTRIAHLATTEYTTAPRLVDLLPSYQSYQLDRRKRRPRGVARYLDNLRKCFRALGPEATIADLTFDRLDAYLSEIGARLAANTALLEVSALRSFCKWAARKRLLSDDPARDLDAPKKHRPAPKPLTRQQLRDLFRVIAEPRPDTPHQRAHWARNRRVIFLMLFAGLRLAEVTTLRWRDVELEASTLTVRQGKGGKDRAIPLHPALVAELRKNGPLDPDLAVAGCIDHQPYTDPQALAHIFERYIPRVAAKLGLKLRFSAHQLRHTFATEMLRGGAGLPAIQGLLGHASLETTQCYLLVDAGQFQDAVNVLPAGW